MGEEDGSVHCIHGVDKRPREGQPAGSRNPDFAHVTNLSACLGDMQEIVRHVFFCEGFVTGVAHHFRFAIRH